VRKEERGAERRERERDAYESVRGEAVRGRE